MSNEQMSSSRPSRGAGPSVSTTLSVVVAVIAVLVAFLVLRDVNRDRGTVSSAPDTTSAPVATTTPETTPPETTTTIITTGFKVLVANASGVGGSAGQMTTALQARGFVVLEPTNKSEAFQTLETTVVYVSSGFEDAAASVASVLGGVEVLSMPGVIPTEDGTLGEATVLVMLGLDLAGKPLPGTATTTIPAGDAETTTTVGG